MTITTENEPKLENEAKTAQENKEVQQDESKPKVFSKQGRDEKHSPKRSKRLQRVKKTPALTRRRRLKLNSARRKRR